MSSDNLVDIHELIAEFNHWQKHWIELWREKGALKDELEASRAEVLQLKKKEKIHHQEMEDMRKMVGSIQKALHQSYDREEKNETLQKAVESLKKNMSTLREKHNEEISVMHKKMEEVAGLHKVEMESMKEVTLMEAEEQRQAQAEEMQKKTDEYEQLQEELKKFEQEKQSELCFIRMEYDSKFMKLQKQAAKIPQSNTMSTINQDIFRKKLQHSKAESEREINSLKRKVEELQQKLTTQDVRPVTTFQTPTQGPAKRRRF